MAKSSFIKFKKIFSEYFNKTSSVNRLGDKFLHIDSSISKEQIKEVQKKLLNMNLIEYNGVRGEYKFNTSLLSQDFFDNSNKNNEIISSLAFAEVDKIENILKYVFKETPLEIKKQTVLQYTNIFDNVILKLLSIDENKKYHYLSYLVNENKEDGAYKIKCSAEINNNTYTLYPAKLVVSNDAWYLCSLDYKTNEYRIDNQNDISAIKIIDHNSAKSFDIEKMKNFINEFSIDSDYEKINIIISSLESLNTIINLELLDRYDFYEEVLVSRKKDFNDDNDMRSCFITSDSIENEYSLKKIRNISTNSFKNFHPEKIQEMEFKSGKKGKNRKNYHVHIKTSKTKMKILIKLFHDKMTILSCSMNVDILIKYNENSILHHSNDDNRCPKCYQLIE